MPQMRVLPTNALHIDADVQLAFALEPRRVDWMAGHWDEGAVGFLVVCQNASGFSIIDGRHRFLAGSRVGKNEWRCDIHDDVQTAAEKAALKLALDFQRRHVRRIEHFIERVIAREQFAVDINAIVESVGFEVGKLSGGRPLNRIESAATLERIYNSLDGDGLRRTLQLNTVWLAQEQSGITKGDWLSALALLVRDGYDEALTPAGYSKLRAIVPEELVRRARGEMARKGLAGAGSNDTNFSGLAYETATLLRKKAGLRQRPASKHKQRGGKEKPL